LKIEASVNKTDLSRVVRELKQIDNDSIKMLRLKLKTGLTPVAAAVDGAIPKEAPISGMQRSRRGTKLQGRTKWRGANKTRIEFYPGRSQKGWANLVVMTVTGGKRGVGFDMAELAGVRKQPGNVYSRPYTRRTGRGTMTREYSHRVTTQGDQFINALQAAKPIKGKAGRYAYDAFLKQRPATIRIATGIINDVMKSYNRKFQIKGGA